MKTVKLGEYVKTITPKTKLQAKKFLSVGEFPVVSQEAGLINGYWNQADAVMHFNKSVVVFGDHTRVVKYIDFDFVSGADGTKILLPPDDLDTKYLYYWFLANPIDGLGYARHFRILKDKEISIPTLKEQRRVVERLDAVFEKIYRATSLTEKNITETNLMKSSMLTDAFSVANSETVKLGDVCEFKPAKSLAKNKFGENVEVSFAPMEQLPIGKKYFMPKQTKKLDEVYSSYVYFEDNDVIYAKITPCFENGKMSIAKGLKNGVGFGSSEFVPIRCSDKILPEYLYYFLLKPSFIEYGSQNMRGASGHKRVPDELTKELLIPLPSLEEQRRVLERLDAVFEKIDATVELRNKKLMKLNELKQSALTQAFSGSGVE